jgi:hypothetical protein
MSIFEPRCGIRHCVHLQGVRDIEGAPEEELGGHEVPFCNAFPKGIPAEISFGDNLHLVPLKGQGNEIVFNKEEI